MARGDEVKLTPTEYDTLRYLALQAGRLVTHKQLLRTIRGVNYQEETHYLHTL
jgi:two-component system KDP operon response regulator KdpE